MTENERLEHEYRLNRKEWLYKEIHELSDLLTVADAIELALYEQHMSIEPDCKRVKEYYETYSNLDSTQQNNIARNWDKNSMSFEDCIEPYLKD